MAMLLIPLVAIKLLVCGKREMNAFLFVEQPDEVIMVACRGFLDLRGKLD